MGNTPDRRRLLKPGEVDYRHDLGTKHHAPIKNQVRGAAADTSHFRDYEKKGEKSPPKIPWKVLERKRKDAGKKRLASWPKDVGVYIPSFNRISAPHYAIEAFRNAWIPTTLIVRPEEYFDYEQQFPAQRVIALPSGIKNIGDTRQHIITRSPERYVIMVDDDVRLLVRTGGPWMEILHDGAQVKRTSPRLLRASVRQLQLCMESLIERLKQYPQVGISLAPMNRDTEVRIRSKTCAMCSGLVGFDTKVLHDKGFVYPSENLFEDHDMTLQILSGGLENHVSFTYALEQGKVDAHGGCDRSYNAVKDGVYALEKRFPNSVIVDLKKPPGRLSDKWGTNQEGIRYEVRITWKKTHRIARERMEA